MLISICTCEWLHICNPATGASIVNTHTGDNDSIRENDMTVYCLIKVCQLDREVFYYLHTWVYHLSQATHCSCNPISSSTPSVQIFVLLQAFEYL